MRRTLLMLLAVTATVTVAAGSGASAPSRLKVGLVVSAGAIPDRENLFGLPYDGFIRAVNEFGVQGRVLQVAPNQDATGPLSLLARQRYDLVIVGLPGPDASVAVARDFPNTRFMLPDDGRATLDHPPRNIQGTVFRAQEAGYLAGYLAALMEKRRPGRDVLGLVGGYPFPGVDRWIVGFDAGAKRADPGITTLTTYAYSFTNPTKCRAIALDQIARGAGAIFNVAGACGIGALDAAKEKGVWGIGVDIDQSFLGPHILTSAVSGYDVGVRDAIERLVHGTFTTGGDTVFDLRNGGVGLGRISPRVPRTVIRQVDAVRRQIIAGTISVPSRPSRS